MNKEILKFGLFLFVAVTISACGTTKMFEPKQTVKVITTHTYPELPDIQPLPPLNLLPWKHDVPRDLSKLEVKNLSTCINVPEDERDDSFWVRCGEHPIITDTNIFIGFDQENWNIIVENFSKLRERIFQYEKRIEEVNKQRAEWRKKTEKEQKKVEESKTSSDSTN